MPGTLLEQLALFVNKTEFEQIPSDVKDMAKIRVIDFLAALAMGMKSGVENFLIDAPHHSLLPQAMILFSGQLAPVADAAACNSYIATSSGMEDGSRYAGAHPSSAIIPAAFAAAQHTGASGIDVITAIILAYEVHLRIGYAIYPYVLRQRFHSSAILAPLGAAAAAGKLHHLDPGALTSALAIACLSSSGMICAFDAYPSKCYQIARAVKGGVEAAMLAKNGMPGPAHALEHSFLKAFGNTQTLDLNDLGKRFLVGESYLKIHGGCRHIHPVIDAAIDIRKTENLSVEDVSEIFVGITSAANAMERENVGSHTDARFNTPFLMALALKEGEVTDEQITDLSLSDKAIKDLCAKTKVAVDPDLDVLFPVQRGAKVSLILKNGRILKRDVRLPLGEPENPLPEAMVEHKFKKALTGILKPSGINFLYDFIHELEHQKHLNLFFDTISENLTE